MNGTAPQLVVAAVALVGVVLAGLRWLRVAQREHYVTGWVSRFAGRWWGLGVNLILAGIGVAGLVLAVGRFVVAAGVLTGLAAAAGPLGLGLRGRTGSLAWTARLRSLAGVAAWVVVVAVALGAVGAWLAGAGAALGAMIAALVCAAGSPWVLDLALAVTSPIQRRRLQPYITKAKARLAAERPTVVAITGSYGKTSTKGYVTQLVTGTRSIVPSPASYNNRGGLARAINDHLVPGTEVFVAEMGTYGPGEIAEMCSWIPPDISVITAIGPVHLERMHDEATITRAKSEILTRAQVVVLNVDSPWLAPLADQADQEGKTVWRVSANDVGADVYVEPVGRGFRVQVNRVAATALAGRAAQPAPAVFEVADSDASLTNVGCALSVALALGVEPAALATRLATLQPAPHRRTVEQGRGGATVVDDTFNSNPDGARAALDLAASLVTTGKRLVVVTPGMVELGRRQGEANAAFAAQAAQAATDLVIVGRTNRRALLRGAGDATRVTQVATRPDAVAWVASQLGPGDVVLYENDLPDHFP